MLGGIVMMRRMKYKLSKQLNQALKQIGDLTDELGQTRQEMHRSPLVSQLGPTIAATQ